jgi:putative spermidine/putrescine transport system substrate-binding protein
MTARKITRRRLIAAGTATAVGTLVSPAILKAQTATLKITTWGGKWGDIMKGRVLPAFEKEHKCSVLADQAFPFLPKLQASPKADPIYDVLHANSNEQWKAAELGLVLPRVDAKDAPNVADVYPYAVSDKIVGISIFTSAIGLGYRTDKGLTAPKSWKDLADPKLAGQRGSYLIPVNSLGQAHLMMLGKIYGNGFEDLDAAYKALEQLKPIKLFDFTGQMEKAMLSGEVSMAVIHDSGIYRYDAEKPPLEFVVPSEGVVALEQVLTVTPGSKVRELAHAYVDYMLRPDVQKELAEGVWYSPSNKKVKLEARYDARLFNSEAKVAKLMQMPWKWYNDRKDEIDSRVQRILRG